MNTITVLTLVGIVVGFVMAFLLLVDLLCRHEGELENNGEPMCMDSTEIISALKEKKDAGC